MGARVEYYSGIKQKIGLLRDELSDNRERPVLTSGNISYANWWKCDPDKYWFTRYIRSSFPDCRTPIRFYSVFGPRRKTEESFNGIKVFFSGENLDDYSKYEGMSIRYNSDILWHQRKKKFDDYAVSKMDISMGFRRQDHDNYFRFPLWITYLFEPEDDIASVRRKINIINSLRNDDSVREIAAIATHDFYGTRAAICDELSKNGFYMDYPGKWRNNTDKLWNRFDNDKLKYLSSIRFNVCPENTDSDDYVTEKLFDAFRAGTIPIYHGSHNDPEPGLINRESVIFWNYDRDNNDNINKIKLLYDDDSYYQSFMNQTRIYPQMADYVKDRMDKLRKMLEPMIQ